MLYNYNNIYNILYLLPIWSIQFFPTQDGPSHVYNSFILKEYFNTKQYPLLQQYYDLNLQPMPNWFGHIVIASLMFIVDPLIAEKIMLSGYVILFLYAGRFLIIGVGRSSFLSDKSPYSFCSDISTNSLPLLLFPFVYNYLLHMGFYNFSYSVGFCLLAVGYWWDNHQKLGYKQAIVFNLIMVCCYFSHMVSTVITLIVVSILWLLTFRRSNLKKHLWQIPMLLPSCVLPIWFILSHGTKSNHVHWPIRRLYEYVSNLEVLFSFTTFQLKLGKILSACFLLLLILTLLNSLIKKVFGRSGLHPTELLSVYVLLSSACSLCSINTMGFLFTTLGHSTWFATPENEWAELFWSYMPEWLTVSDMRVLNAYYNGESSLYSANYMMTWIIPVLSWTSFIIVLLFVMLCINVILRKQWLEKERLSYPIIEVPFEITRDIGSIFKNRLFLLSFVLTGFITLLNGISFLHPVVPRIMIRQNDISYLFTSKPWNAISWTPLVIQPFVVGMGFLMPLELSFSCWIFYFFRKCQRVFASLFGIRGLPWSTTSPLGFPYDRQQSLGAYLALAVFALRRPNIQGPNTSRKRVRVCLLHNRWPRLLHVKC